MKKFILLMIISGVALFSMTGCERSYINIELSDFAEISVYGYEGAGTAYVQVQWTDLEMAILQGEEIDFSSALMLLEVLDTVSYSLDKDDGLSNGDIVTLIVSWDSAVAEKHGLDFSAENKTVTVMGLKEQP